MPPRRPGHPARIRSDQLWPRIPFRHSFRLAPENTFASRPYERCAGCWLMNDPLETSVGQRWHLGALARRVTAYAGSTLVIILLIGASMNSAGFGAMRFRSSDA